MAQKNWEIQISKEHSVPQGRFTKGIEELSIETLIALILENRGIKTEEEKQEFLHPKLEDVTIESVGIDVTQVEKTIQRITQAINNQEQIIAYGDYDVDGITGAAILWETLHSIGARVMPYIPHRVEEGYGLSVKGITNVKELYPDTKLIITVDNGIVANEAVAFANSQHIEVIITDHHVSAGEGKPHPGTSLSEKSSEYPAALAIVHTTKLCGAGVAYLLTKEIIANNNQKPVLKEDTHLELAALGTIADLVPLTGANRTIVKFGLKKLQQTQRIGLQALFQEAEIDSTSLGVYQVGHQIGPRLNATGRMESAMDSLRLLCTKDSARAHQLAQLLGKTNKERQQVMFQATEHASLTVKERKALKKLLIVSHDTYPEGVIGLVAGRLVEEYYRPAIVIARGEKLSKGSVRSVNGFNIIEFLRSASEYFVNVGGHPMAAGFSVETEKIEKLQEVLEEMAEELLNDTTLTRVLRIDAVIPFSLITQELFHAINQLAPFGMGNPDPTFVSEKVEIKDMRLLGKEGKHMRLILQQDFGPILEAVAFGMGERFNEFTKGDLIDVAYTIDENTWQGQTKLQLKIKDIKKKNDY